MSFNAVFDKAEIILTEGALVERLKSEFHLKMDGAVNHAGLIYSHPEILSMLYRQYIDIAQKQGFPIMIMTPTRRVNAESMARSKFANKPLLADSIKLLNRVRSEYGDYQSRILLGGLLGCKGDAYSGEKVMDTCEAYEFHTQQTRQFIDQRIDFLFAGIMPEFNEAEGMARAMAETGIPYIISFMVQKEGTLLDGTVLIDAIKRIDENVDPGPVCYMANCIHPANLRLALLNQPNLHYLNRFKGIQANASILSPEELNNCPVVEQDDFNHLVNEMYQIKKQFELKIVGGCCGTNNEFISILADKLKEI